jgi:hypothetical protein
MRMVLAREEKTPKKTSFLFSKTLFHGFSPLFDPRLSFVGDFCFIPDCRHGLREFPL